MNSPSALALAGLLGLAVGSFLNVCIYRLPLRQSIAFPPSRCPRCGRGLSWYDNIPVLSWLALRGRCRQCGEPISVQYPIVEFVTAVLFVAVVWLSPAVPLVVSRLVLGCALIVLFMIDLEHQILPNVITLPGIAVGLALSLIAPPGIVDALLGAALGAGVLYAIAAGYYLWRKEEGMGMGDVKMLAMIGAFLGWQAVLLTLILSSFSGAIIGIGILATSRGSMRYALPFGTFLALGALVAMLSGDAIFGWYLGLFDPTMNPTSWALLGLSLIVALLVGVLLFAVLRLGSALRGKRRGERAAGDSMLLTSAMEDAITRLKAQERATAARAEASEQLSGEIVASLTSGLVVVDNNGRVQTVNPAARRILQLDDPARVPDSAILDEVPALGAVIQESLRTSHPVLRRTLALERSGESMRLGVSVSPIAAERASSGAICLFSDLTDVFALEEQLRLKEALARLGELTAGLAHEFRNGLATIHGYARLMDPAVLPAAQRPYIEGIRAETQALGEIVTRFLSFAGPYPLALAPMDLRTIVERAAEDAPAAQLTIEGEFVSVDADEVLLRQAISNLFRNSVEACNAQGRTAQIDVRAHVDRAHGVVHLTLADNGPGIAPDALPRVFQPFFTQRPGGTGLGLAIVQKVIVSHNGRVSAANRPEGGALFSVTLPLSPENAASES